MSYRPIKKHIRQINLAKLDDFDLYFEEVPVSAAYKLRRHLKRNMRKLKVA